MAADAVTMVAESPLDASQVSKASSALLKHISSTQQAKAVQTSKKNLLADEDALSDSYTSTTPNNPADTPLWLILTTKHHIADTPRLKPGKIPIPHSLHPPNTTRILLITASPQRTYKDLLAHPAFPAPLAARIARVIDVGKLKAKFKAFEAKRQLAAEHDVVLADERVTPLLPGLLGKVFFRGGAKRPVPVRLTGKEKFEKRPEVGRRRPKEAKKLVGGPRDVADEIEKALAAALVHLAPSTTTAVKVGYAAWSAEMVAANVNALVPALVERFVPRKWSNVKSVHLKGPETAALPIYMADELWVDEAEDVREDGFVEDVETKKVKASKRLLLESGNENGDAPQSRKEKSAKSSKKDKRKADEAGDELEKEIAAKKAKLKKTKAAAMSKGGVEL